jgi:hypothetical protein
MALLKIYSNEQQTHSALRDEDLKHTVRKDVMGGPCTVYSMELHNDATGGVRYVKLFDAVNPTMGTTIPDFVFEVANNFRSIMTFPAGITFVNGLSFAATTEQYDNSSVDPSSSGDFRISIVAK